jgi:DDE superfamily endonuclease
MICLYKKDKDISVMI